MLHPRVLKEIRIEKKIFLKIIFASEELPKDGRSHQIYINKKEGIFS